MISLSIHKANWVQVEMVEVRDRDECHDFDRYEFTVRSTTVADERMETTLILFAKPGADIGLDALFPQEASDD